MTRLNPALFDIHRREAAQLRRAAIAEFHQNANQYLRRWALALAALIRSPFVARSATQTSARRSKAPCPSAYLHLVIARQIDPAVRQLIARHTDALIADELGQHAGTATIRIDGTPSDHWFPAAASSNGQRPITIHADLQIGSGRMNPRQKGALIDRLYTFFHEVFGDLAETSRIVIREIPAHDCFPNRQPTVT